VTALWVVTNGVETGVNMTSDKPEMLIWSSVDIRTRILGTPWVPEESSTSL